jgi:hypothetical protein
MLSLAAYFVCCGGSMHHRLQGDIGVPALETCQHVLHHLHGEHGVHLPYRVLIVKRAEAKGRQRGFILAQEILDLLHLNRPHHLELLHLLACGGQLLELFLS